MTAQPSTDAAYGLAQQVKGLRPSDVSDGLDAVGRAIVGLVDPAVGSETSARRERWQGRLGRRR
jgi:hypothetical protein